MPRHLQDHAAKADGHPGIPRTHPNRRLRALAVRRALRVGRAPAPAYPRRPDAVVRAIGRGEEIGTAALVVIVAFFLLRFVLAWGQGLMR